jgi:hypothetical protein
MAGPEREESRQLLKHWKRFRGEKRLPEREDVRLDELDAYAPHLFVIDIETQDRFILKQLGSAVLERFNGFDIRGLNLLDFVKPVFRERLQARVRMIFEFGYAACTHTSMPSTDGRVKRTENVMLPVGNNAGGFRQIFGSIYYTEGPDNAARHTSTSDGLEILDESFIDLGSGYAAIINASELPDSVFPGNPDQ